MDDLSNNDQDSECGDSKPVKINSCKTNEKNIKNSSNEMTIEERIYISFASVGFPAIQASVCMNICILCLLFVNVYIAQVYIYFRLNNLYNQSIIFRYLFG